MMPPLLHNPLGMNKALKHHQNLTEAIPTERKKVVGGRLTDTSKSPPKDPKAATLHDQSSQSSSCQPIKTRVWSPPHIAKDYAVTKKEAKLIKIDISNILRRLQGLSIQDFKDVLPDMLDHSKISTKILQPQQHMYDVAIKQLKRQE